MSKRVCPACGKVAFCVVPAQRWADPRYPIWRCRLCGHVEERFKETSY